MNEDLKATFLKELEECANNINSYLHQKQYIDRFQPAHISDAVTLYTRSGGKRLRPAILLWSCGATGGNPELAIPAAAAVEVFHTWTLVHDDIIDRDDMRRGGKTVHEHFRQGTIGSFSHISAEESAHYGVSIGILTGDVQHGWGISMMTELTTRLNLDPMVTLELINDLDTEVLNKLVEGEVLDIQFSYLPISEISVEAIEDMLYKKTGVLYRFCARAGAQINLGSGQKEHPQVIALEKFASKCGLAFQLQDDVLGIVGNQNKLGKPVGSDIREGKRTTVVHYAYQEADKHEQQFMSEILGKENATEKDIEKMNNILINRGGVEKTQQRAKHYIESALEMLETIPQNKYRDLLRAWADYMVSRSW